MNKSFGIPLGELVENPTRIVNRVMRNRKPLAIEKRGKVIFLLMPARARLSPRRKNKVADRKAFLAAAGSWKDIDTDKLVADNYSSRKRSSRPAAQL